MPASGFTVTIPAGQAISEPVGLVGKGSVLWIRTPIDWTPANISFQLSLTNVDYWDLYTVEGQEWIVDCGPNRVIMVANDTARCLIDCFLKIRSGTAEIPVIQDMQREFAFVML